MSNYPFEANQDIDNQRSGIYAIVNLANNKLYIGSAVKLKQRRNKHLQMLRDGCHTNIRLQRSFNKFGENSFIFKVVEYCETNILINREQFWLDKYFDTQNCYNILKIAGSSFGYKHSDEIKEILRQKAKRENLSLETLQKMSVANSRPHTDDWKTKMKDKMTGRKHSEESKNKMKLKAIGRRPSKESIDAQKKITIQIDKDNGQEINRFDSVTEAGEKTKINPSNISSVCLGQRQTAGGYRWCYVN